ncbi:MAG: DUF362 domain-containing protein [Desulfobacteraceae bacterium]|nr:MAG: DUF362 domain-containing protein [Desulfobacteraceae bacterium]
MVKPLVIVAKGDDPYNTTKMALKRFPLPDLKGKRILIKPNAARLASPGEGITTHPSVVSATIDCLRENGAKDIVIGEGCIFGVDARDAFRMTGMEEISEKKNVKLIDMDRFGPAERAIPNGKLLKKVKVSSMLKDFDWIVSIPVMKTHMHTRVSLSIKNMKGLLWRREKAKLHHLRSNKKITRGYKELDFGIAEMAAVLMPDLAVIDGTVGMEGMGPAYGKPKKMGIVLVSDSPVSADAVASRLMGFAPEEIPYLQLSAEKGLGEIQLQNISVEPQDYLKWEDPFDLPPSKFSIPFPDVVVYDEGSCSACLSTLLLFLQKYHQQLDDYRLADKKVHIGIGKYLDSCPEGTILIGNCTSNIKNRGIFIKGCPPISSEIMRTLVLIKERG